MRAELREAVIVDGQTVLPAGTEVVGNVTDVERSGRVKGRARVAYRFNSLSIGGERYDIATAPISHQAEATKGEDATKIAIGAGAGAAVGAMLGGGDGAAKGAAIGGAAGTASVLATRGKEVRLGPGARRHHAADGSADGSVRSAHASGGGKRRAADSGRTKPSQSHQADASDQTAGSASHFDRGRLTDRGRAFGERRPRDRASRGLDASATVGPSSAAAAIARPCIAQRRHSSARVRRPPASGDRGGSGTHAAAG